jgi:hypothetical protein
MVLGWQRAQLLCRHLWLLFARFLWQIVTMAVISYVSG